MGDNRGVWFAVLGALEVRDRDGRAVPVSGARARTLMVLLALEAGRSVPLDRLIDAQYGDDPPAGAANAVQAQVSRLRRALPDDVIAYDGTGYRLLADPDDVDAHRFESLAAEGRRLLAAGRPAEATEPLTAALALWRGPALADLPVAASGDVRDAVGEGVAARLDELRLTALEDLAEAHLTVGDATQVAELRRLVAAHPLRERAAALLMRALTAEDRRAEALEVYEETREVLGDRLGTDPSPELAALHLDLLRDEPAAHDRPRPPSPGAPDGPGVRGLVTAGMAGTAAPPARRSGVPAQLTSFVGRAAELERLREIGEHGGPRLVTVVGPGGIGKTRLAVEAAARSAREVCLADLSAAGADQVPAAVLTAVGVRDPGYRHTPMDPTDRLVAALAGRELLLVLDNCEHVVAAAAAVTRTLLATCPGLSILATSREPLSLTGETLIPLRPLPVPRAPAGDGPAPAGVPDGPAVRLFADRAAAVRPGFAVDASNADQVARICAALDGLPLAIELAAARLRALTVDDVAARLADDDRFALLSRGDRTAAARHQTLRAVVEWSWALLTPAERTLARRLAVFPDGAVVAAITAICAPPTDRDDIGEPTGTATAVSRPDDDGPGRAAGDAALGGADVREVLADLVDKSLVTTDGHRYRMLDTIRLFCAERLAEAGEEERVRARHAAYYLDLARAADPHLRRAEQLDWLARLSAEHGNLMAALRWAERHEPDTALRLIAALAAYMWLRGCHAEAGPAATRLLPHATAALGQSGSPGTGLEEEYLMCVVHAVPRAAPGYWARGHEVVQVTDRQRRYPFAVAVWGMAAGPPPGDSAHAGKRILDPDPWNRALLRLSDALMTWLDGVPAGAEGDLTDALAEFEALGERWGTAQCLDWLAVLASWRGDWPRAEHLWARALHMLEELGATDETVDILTHRAESRTRASAPRPTYDADVAPTAPPAGPAGAVADLRRAGELARTAGAAVVPASVRLGLGDAARSTGDAAAARREYTAALAAIEDDGWRAGALRARVATALGHLAAAAGAPSEAAGHYAEAVSAARDAPTTEALITALTARAAAVLLPGEDEASAAERAAVLLGAAAAARGTEIAGDPDTARVAETARAVLGPDAYDAAHTRGAALPRADVLATLTSP